MRKSDRILGWILLGLALISLGEGLRTWDKIGGTGFMPVIVGSIFACLALGFYSAGQIRKKINLFSGAIKRAGNG